MSRRQSRSSLGTPQTDALYEFEQFKKKFLLANKHITKLNSTLSVRIEELNAEITVLHVENLRLRSSEIALAAQLKKERQRSQTVLLDAEAASQSLVKHLSYLRESFGIPLLPPSPPPIPAPKARKPIANFDAEATSPYLNRISRPPTIPGINEEDEPSAYELFSTTGEENHKSTTPHRKKTKIKSAKGASGSNSSSNSKLPMPARPNTPAVRATVATTDSDLEPLDLTTVKKPSRRQSGLLSVRTESLATPRSGSPAFGSPIRLEAGRAFGSGNTLENAGASDAEASDLLDSNVRDKKTGRNQPPSIQDDEPRPVATSRRKKERADETENERAKTKESSRTALQPIDPNVHNLAEERAAPKRSFLANGPRTSSPTPPPRSSSPPPVPSDGELAAARERRVRKSVNYAEPKLNTKMRKPDPPPGTEVPKARKRSSSAMYRSADAFSAPESSELDTKPGFEPFTGFINPGSVAAMYSPSPTLPATSSMTTTSASSSSIASNMSSSSSITAVPSLKRKNSRPAESDDELESDLDEDQDEFVTSGRSSLGGAWVGLERRKGLPRRSAATAAVAALDDIRRHSMVL